MTADRQVAETQLSICRTSRAEGPQEPVRSSAGTYSRKYANDPTFSRAFAGQKGPGSSPRDSLVRLTSAGEEGEGVGAATLRMASRPQALVSTGRVPALCPSRGWYVERSCYP